MSLINISETQLSFAYLHAYLNANGIKKFILPSLRQEGGLVKSPHLAGADLIIENNLFIQFKRPFYLKTSKIKEFSDPLNPNKYVSPPIDFYSPYYRFFIKNSDFTNQLERLIKATDQGFKAQYVSPLFFDDTILFDLMKDDKTFLNSFVHIDIRQFKSLVSYIGKNDNHTILYTQKSVSNGYCYCFSEPNQIEASKNFENNDFSKREFELKELLNLMKNIFGFEETTSNFNEEELFYEIQNLQRNILIRHDIFWIFNFKHQTQ